MIFLRINCPNVIGLVWRRRQCQTASGATAARPHGVLIVAAPPRHSTPPSTALIEGKGVNRFQARSVALLVYKCVSMEQHLVPSSAGGLRGSTSSTFRLITDMAVNCRRPSLSRRCSSRLEQSATACHVCTITVPRSRLKTSLGMLLLLTAAIMTVLLCLRICEFAHYLLVLLAYLQVIRLNDLLKV